MENTKKCERCIVNDRAKGAYKYCDPCREIVKREANKKRLQRNRRKLAEMTNEKCERCEIEPKWSSNLATKYCYKCRMIVENEKIKLKNKAAQMSRAKKSKRIHKKLVKDTNPRAANAKAMSKELYANCHLGYISKKKISEFRYVKLLKDCILAEKQAYSAKRKYKGNDQMSGSEKLARRKAIIHIDKLIFQLSRGGEENATHGRLLRLEKEYVNVYEKQLLIMMIEDSTKMSVGGSYTLAEAGDILGVTRERARQIESGAEKVLNHPMVARKLKAMLYE